MWSAAFVGACVLMGRWVLHVIAILRYPFEWSSMDGYFVSYGQRLLQGLPIYSDHAVPPMGFEYVPGYLLALAPLNALFGPDVWVERALAAGLAGAIAAVAGHVVRVRTGSVLWGLGAVAFCFASPVVSMWYLVRGIDLLVFAVTLTGTALLAERSRLSGPFVVGVALLFALGFYCKQTTVFPWLAATAIVWVRARRLTPVFVAAGVLVTVCIGVALQVWSGGWFWNNAFVTTSRNPFGVARLLGMVQGFTPWVFGVFAGAVAGACWSPKAGLREPWVYFWAASLGSMILAGKLGAAPVYFVPAYIASVIWAGQALPNVLHSLAPGRRILIAGGAFAQVLVWAWLPFPAPGPGAQENAARLLAGIRERPGRVLVERADSFATLAGREVEWEAVQLPILHKIHRMPLDHLLEDLREQRLAAVLYNGRFFNGMYWLRRTIFTYYEPADGLQAVSVTLFYGDEPYTLLVPKPVSALPDEPLLPPAASPGSTTDAQT